jgi:hypothetical protein
MKLWISNNTIKHQDDGETRVYTFNISQIVRTVPNEAGTHLYIDLSNGSDSFFIDHERLTQYNNGVVPTLATISTALDTALKNNVILSGATETPTMTVYAAGVTVAAGAKSVTIITDSTYAGTILTAVASSDSIYTFTATPGNTLTAIAITRSAGNFTVITIA